MTKRRLTPLALLIAAAGCGPDPDAPTAGVPALNPEDSGAFNPEPVLVAADRRAEGRGHPDRLPAGLARAVRGGVEVRVDMAECGEKLLLHVTVHTRGDGRLDFAGWDDPAGVGLRGPDGSEYPLLPPTPAERQAWREWEEKQPNREFGTGAGLVERGRWRVAVLRFDAAAAAVDHLDLDLDGAAVGFDTPIFFRIPRGMILATLTP